MRPITSKLLPNETREYTNIITDFLDKRIVLDHQVTIKYCGQGSYMLFLDPHGAGIRFPGATRGAVEWDEKYYITKIYLYPETKLCYLPDTERELQKFVGRRIIVPKGGVY